MDDLTYGASLSAILTIETYIQTYMEEATDDEVAEFFSNVVGTFVQTALQSLEATGYPNHAMALETKLVEIMAGKNVN